MLKQLSLFISPLLHIISFPLYSNSSSPPLLPSISSLTCSFLPINSSSPINSPPPSYQLHNSSLNSSPLPTPPSIQLLPNSSPLFQLLPFTNSSLLSTPPLYQLNSAPLSTPPSTPPLYQLLPQLLPQLIPHLYQLLPSYLNSFPSTHNPP